MKKLLAFVAIVGGLVAAYLYAYPIYNFRYRVTVEVEVDGNVRSGESVVEVRWVTWPPFIPLDVSRDYSIDLHGEAVFVDLGPTHLPLILTLSTSAAEDGCRTCASFGYLPLRVYEVMQGREGLSTLGQKMKSRAEVNRAYWPGFITFENRLEPTSVRFVHPRRLDEVLGPGIRLRAVTIEATDAPVTQRLGENLPWVRKPLKDGFVGHLEGAAARSLYVRDLIAPDPP